YRPGLKVAEGRLLMALVTKTVSPHTIGLEWARPGIGVRQRMLCPVAGLHVSGRFCRSLTPDASRPRNEGQSPALSFAGLSGDDALPLVRAITRGASTPSPPG